MLSRLTYVDYPANQAACRVTTVASSSEVPSRFTHAGMWYRHFHFLLQCLALAVSLFGNVKERFLLSSFVEGGINRRSPTNLLFPFQVPELFLPCHYRSGGVFAFSFPP